MTAALNCPLSQQKVASAEPTRWLALFRTRPAVIFGVNGFLVYFGVGGRWYCLNGWMASC
jgi:hypothetical protein